MNETFHSSKGQTTYLICSVFLNTLRYSAGQDIVTIFKTYLTTASNSDYIVKPKGYQLMIKEERTWKEADMPSLETGSHHVPGGTEEHPDSQSVVLDMNLSNTK